MASSTVSRNKRTAINDDHENDEDNDTYLYTPVDVYL